MRDDAARALRADEDDYEYLRSRANAELHAVPSRPRAVQARPIEAPAPRAGDSLSAKSRRRLHEVADLDFSVHAEPPAEEEPAPAPEPAPAARYEMRRPTRPRAVESPQRNRPVSGVEGRRTIEITGQAAPPRRHATPGSAFVARPDRIMLYGFLLGIFMILMAVSTAHAAV
jgi:hypothetical protein